MVPVYKNNFVINSRKAVLLCGLFVLFSLVLFASGFWGVVKSAGLNSTAKEASLRETENLIRQKREEIRQIQTKIRDYNSKIKEQQKKARTLKRDIAIYQNRISKNELEIKETQLEIEKSEMEIESIKSEVVIKERKIEKDREMLRDFIKLLYSYEQDSILEVLITKDSLSDFFNEVGAVEYIKNDIFETIVNLRMEREELNSRKQELVEQQEQKEQLIRMKFQQNRSLGELSAQRKKLLEITKGEEKKFQQILDENKKILPFLKSQLRDLQSLGKKIKFNDAISTAKHIGAITGVRPEFLLGILKVESNLGTNVGGGNYKVDMRPRQRPVFEAITRELGYDPNEMPVSKKPRSYKGWGGAMGPAQMMPTTWRVYQNEVAEITGHYPPDPWDLTDAIAAMAVKVSKVQGVTDGDYDAEYKAAGLYFAGRNWRKFLFYPDRVMLYTDLYAKELN
jgi:peptidoglycan hydrolase CwlO-like protein